LGSLLSLNARITPQENKKATVTLFWRESWDFLQRDFEEGFPNTAISYIDVEYGCVNGVFRLEELSMDGAPCRRYVFVRIQREGERCGLFIAKGRLQSE
jgi:hypothetical protein